jgi:DNA-damage-inducible protein J
MINIKNLTFDGENVIILMMERGVVMENLTTAISVQVDRRDKELATGILSNLGLNMSSYVNMAIKQLINKDGVPFEVVNPRPSKELLEAIQEGEDILSGKTDAKSYTNMYEMLEDLKA